MYIVHVQFIERFEAVTVETLLEQFSIEGRVLLLSESLVLFTSICMILHSTLSGFPGTDGQKIRPWIWYKTHKKKILNIYIQRPNIYNEQHIKSLLEIKAM